MRLTICDKCGGTDKPIGKARLMLPDELVITDNIVYFRLGPIDGIDLCDGCHDEFDSFRSHPTIEEFIGVR
jgi:hypothetical protein